MIYITDNGGEYSSHTLYFYELPDDLPVEDGIYLCEHDPSPYNYRGTDYKVIGVSPRVEWRVVGDTSVPLEAGDLFPVLGSRISKRLHDWLSRCPVSVLRRVVEEQITEHEARGERVAPMWAPQQIKHVDPGWAPTRRRLNELRTWVDRGAPIPPVADDDDEEEEDEG